MSQITDNWKLIFTSHSSNEVFAAKNFLASEGIESFVQNELSAQIYGSAVDTPKLLVKEQDFERANELLIKGGYNK